MNREIPADCYFREEVKNPPARTGWLTFNSNFTIFKNGPRYWHCQVTTFSGEDRVDLRGSCLGLTALAGVVPLFRNSLLDFAFIKGDLQKSDIHRQVRRSPARHNHDGEPRELLFGKLGARVVGSSGVPRWGIQAARGLSKAGWIACFGGFQALMLTSFARDNKPMIDASG